MTETLRYTIYNVFISKYKWGLKGIWEYHIQFVYIFCTYLKKIPPPFYHQNRFFWMKKHYFKIEINEWGIVRITTAWFLLYFYWLGSSDWVFTIHSVACHSGKPGNTNIRPCLADCMLSWKLIMFQLFNKIIYVIWHLVTCFLKTILI